MFTTLYEMIFGKQNFEEKIPEQCCEVFTEMLYCRCLPECGLNNKRCDSISCEFSPCMYVQARKYIKYIKKTGPEIFFEKNIKPDIMTRKPEFIYGRYIYPEENASLSLKTFIQNYNILLKEYNL